MEKGKGVKQQAVEDGPKAKRRRHWWTEPSRATKTVETANKTANETANEAVDEAIEAAIEAVLFSGAQATQQQKLWAKGVRLQADGKLEAATEMLTKSLILCPCQADTRRQFRTAGVTLTSIDPIGRCSCKDFVAAAQTRRVGYTSAAGAEAATDGFPASQLDLEAVYALATTRGCSCGSGRVCCSEPSHVAVVDRLAAVATKRRQLEEATRLAASLVDLAPQRAEGYLQLARAVVAGSRGRAAARFAARCLYAHGLHNVRRHGDGDKDPLVRVLAHCASRYGRGDYLPQLPVEVVEAVLRQLHLRDALVCCRVSKSWGAMMRGVRVRLDEVVLGHRGNGTRINQFRSKQRPPSLATLARFQRRLPHLTAASLELAWTLTEDDAARLSQAQLALLRQFATAERVSLHLSHVLPGQDGSLLPRCRHLRVYGGSSAQTDEALHELLRGASLHLESLDLQEVNGAAMVGLRFPCLRHLNATNCIWAVTTDNGLLPSILMAAPGLEQLRLSDLLVDDLPDRTRVIPGYEAATLLPRVHTFIISGGSVQNVRQTQSLSDQELLDQTYFPHVRAATLRCMDFRGELCYLALAALMRHPKDLLPCLEHMQFNPKGAPNVQVVNHLFDIHTTPRLQSLELNAVNLEEMLLRASPLACPERFRNVGLLSHNWDYNWDLHTSMPGYVAGRTAIDWFQGFHRAEAITFLSFPGANNLLLRALVDSIGRVRQPAGHGTADNETETETGQDTQETEDEKPWMHLQAIYTEVTSSLDCAYAVRRARELGIDIVHRPRGPSVPFPWPDNPDAVVYHAGR